MSDTPLNAQVHELEVTPILSADGAAEVIHGTFLSKWPLIQKRGLSKMGRNHIHCAPGFPGESGVISGVCACLSKSCRLRRGRRTCFSCRTRLRFLAPDARDSGYLLCILAISCLACARWSQNH